MTSVQDLHKELETSTHFIEWKKKHENTFLSHFFCQISSELEIKTAWDIGYFDPTSQKMMTFAKQEEFIEKGEDDVFKKPDDSIDPLDITQVSISSQQALDAAKKCIQEKFSKLQLGDGFIILQTLEGKTVYNISCITKTLQFLNIRVNAQDGTIISSQAINAVEQQ